MNKKLTTIVFLSLLMLSLTISTAASSASLAISVKKGDWIEYNVVASGTFPGENNAQWARLDILDVQGDLIYVNSTTQLTDGTYIYANITINFDTGFLEEGFFLPSNVTVGDTFYDSYVGNVTVTGNELKTYVGAERTVFLGSSPFSTWIWDKAKGIMVEAHSYYPDYNFRYDTIVNRTNMWQPKSLILGLDPAVFYTVAAAVSVAVIALSIGVVILHRKRTI